MNSRFLTILSEVFLSRYKLYRYYLLYKFIKHNRAHIEESITPLGNQVKEEVKAKPLQYLIAAAVIGVLIGRIL